MLLPTILPTALSAGLPAGLLALAGCSSEPKTPHARAITRACQFLWSKQAAGGGWHGEVVGLLRPGQSSLAANAGMTTF